VQGRETWGIFDVMRLGPVVIALLLACSPSPDDVSPFPFGRAHADCGPADGPAVRIQLAASQLPGDLSVPVPRPSLDLVLNAGLTDASGRSFLIDPEGRGQRASAHAVLCGEDGHCVSARSGRVRLDSVREPPAEISGTYDVTLDDGSRHSGRFTAPWIAFSPMCG
jgi:hypothetical protein